MAQSVPETIVLHGHSPAVGATADRLHERGVAYTWGDSTDGRIAEVGEAVVFQTDGRSATQRAAETAIANVALVDETGTLVVPEVTNAPAGTTVLRAVEQAQGEVFHGERGTHQ